MVTQGAEGLGMEEFRRHARWCPVGLAPSGHRLDVVPDYAAFPVWEPAGMSSPQRLGISAELAHDLRAWREWWERHSEYGGGEHASDPERESWGEVGLVLAERLARETGADVVCWWPSGPAGSDPSCQSCRPVRRAR
ncbi:hypothetical protein GCM10027614_27500 [Micromonospora vulcania]